MLLLDSEALSALSAGPAQRRDRVRALIAEMRRRELPVATVAAVLPEVVRGRPADAAVDSTLPDHCSRRMTMLRRSSSFHLK
jgi:hypothetical protein